MSSEILNRLNIMHVFHDLRKMKFYFSEEKENFSGKVRMMCSWILLPIAVTNNCMHVLIASNGYVYIVLRIFWCISKQIWVAICQKYCMKFIVDGISIYLYQVKGERCELLEFGISK